jgi:putative DNA primase/helicase
LIVGMRGFARGTLGMSKGGKMTKPLADLGDLVAKGRALRHRKLSANSNCEFLDGDVQIAQAAVELECAANIKPEPILWLWNDWLALGKMHIVAGQPGVGKSTIAMKFAATVSAGALWPDGRRAKQGKVVIWSGEDDNADTLLPRLEASGADLSRIYFVKDVSVNEQRRPFDPARDIPTLCAKIKVVCGASLIIIDPIVSAVAGDTHKNAETRRALQPLVDMAQELNAAILGITHFTKGSEGRSPIDRVTGSVAFGALARIVIVAAKQQDSEDGKPGSRVLMRAKSNVGPDDGGFAYDLQLVPMREHPDIVASVVSWGEPVTGSARAILVDAEADADDNRKNSTLREAEDWLLDFLMDGPRSAKDCKAESAKDGHSWRTIERIKARLKVSSIKRDGGWVWALPQDQDCRNDRANPGTTANPGGLGGVGGLQQNQMVTVGQGRQTDQDPEQMAVLESVAVFKENQSVTGQDRQDRQHRQGFRGGQFGQLGDWEGEI